MRMIRRLTLPSLLLLGALTAACSGSSTTSTQPIPVGPAETPQLDVQDVKVERSASSTKLVGAAGAIVDEPGGFMGSGSLWALAIDAPGVSSSLSVGDSFEVSLASPTTQMVHVELANFAGAFVRPWNLETKSDGTLGPLPTPHCLSNDSAGVIYTAGAIDFNFQTVSSNPHETVDGPVSTVTLKFTETCGEEENIRVSLHTGKYFRLKDAAPTSIGAHETVSLSIVHAADDPNVQDVDLLVVTDSDPGALVVPLHAEAP